MPRNLLRHTDELLYSTILSKSNNGIVLSNVSNQQRDQRKIKVTEKYVLNKGTK